jgi:cell division protein FtsW (lipid II flippase)
MSGTRTALACFMVGVALYVILSKSFKIAIPVGILGGLFFFIMAFTTIGENNMQIRRMRSAFNPEDKSANVRDINKAALKKYLRDAPFGMGMNIDEGKVPANHKYKVVYETSNDSTYVFMWQRVGIIGAILFAIVNGLILIGGCYKTLFVLKETETKSIGAALCCAFLSIQVGGYMNEILLQFPNLLLFYGGMSIVYLLPDIEEEYKQYEIKMLALQEEKKRLKLEKKLASRV